MELEPIHELARAIAGPMWRGIPREYKTKYALNIWAQFENNLRSAAYTTNLRRFVDTVCARLQISILDRDVAAFNAAVQSGRDKELLRVFRAEPVFITLLVREDNDQRREQQKARHQP